MASFFDEIQNGQAIYTVLTAEQKEFIPDILFKHGRIDHIIHVANLTEVENKQLLMRYFSADLPIHFIDLFIEKCSNLTTGELISLANRLMLLVKSQQDERQIQTLFEKF